MIFFAPLEWFFMFAFIIILGMFFIAFPIPVLIISGLLIWAVVAMTKNTNTEEEQ